MSIADQHQQTINFQNEPDLLEYINKLDELNLEIKIKAIQNLLNQIQIDQLEFKSISDEGKLRCLQVIKSGLINETYVLQCINEKTLKLLFEMINIDCLSYTSYHQEALKCIANALLLSQPTRLLLSKLDLTSILTRSLSHHITDLNQDTKFLFVRILFLATVEPTDLVNQMVHTQDILPIIINLLLNVNLYVQNDIDSTFSKDVLVADILKLAFNLLVNYPKFYFMENLTLSEQGEEIDPTKFILDSMSNVINPILILISEFNGSLLDSPYLQAIQVLINFPQSHLNLALTSISAKKLLDQLSKTIFDLTQQGGYKVESLSDEYDRLAPHLLLINSIILAFPNLREEVAGKLLPNDEGRVEPIGKGTDIGSKLASALMDSGLGPLKDALGELFFNLCQQDADLMVQKLGYGTAAGFLVNRNLQPNFTTPRPTTTRPINPITGQFTDSELNDGLDMSEEDKQREAERLFVLFERMKKNPAIQVKNPVEVAFHAGKLQAMEGDVGSDSD